MEEGLLNPTRQLATVDSDAFLFERATTEHEVAERKRDATLTKSTALATLGAALIAILAAPAFDSGGLAGGAAQWLLLAAVAFFLAAVAFAALSLAVPVESGDRPSRDELDNWTTHHFQLTEARIHVRDFTEMYVEAAKDVRIANEKAETWLTRAVRAMGIGLVLLLLTFVVEVL